jgi:hypothetical protein
MKKTLINLTESKEKIKELLLEQLENTTFYDLSKIDLKLDASKILEETLPDVEDPTIYITPTAYIKMRTLVEETDVEIAWHGVVHRQGRIFVITDILVYPQKITSVTVESDDDLYPNWCMELPDDVLNNMRFQGHSHVNMGVTPSSVDEDYYTRLLTQVHDYYIIMVTNKHEAMTLRLYDVENNILYSDLDLNIYLPDVHKDNIAWYEEQKEMLQKPSAKQESLFKEKILDDDKLDVHTHEGRLLRKQTLSQVANFLKVNFFSQDKQMTIKYIKERIKEYDKLVVVKGKQGKDTKSIAYWGDVDESKYNKPAVVTWELSEDESLYYSQRKFDSPWWNDYYGGSY